MSQFLIHLVRHAEVLLETCHGNRQLPDILQSPSPVSALRAPRRRSLSPDTTKLFSSGRSSFRTSQASRSLAPPTGRANSCRPYCGEQFDASLDVLQKRVVTAPSRPFFQPFLFLGLGCSTERNPHSLKKKQPKNEWRAQLQDSEEHTRSVVLKSTLRTRPSAKHRPWVNRRLVKKKAENNAACTTWISASLPTLATQHLATRARIAK